MYNTFRRLIPLSRVQGWITYINQHTQLVIADVMYARHILKCSRWHAVQLVVLWVDENHLTCVLWYAGLSNCIDYIRRSNIAAFCSPVSALLRLLQQQWMVSAAMLIYTKLIHWGCQHQCLCISSPQDGHDLSWRADAKFGVPTQVSFGWL